MTDGRCRGFIEHAHPTFAYVREARTWRRYFVAGSDMADGGGVPPDDSEVEFTPDDTSDARGPRARAVIVVADPLAPAVVHCMRCGARFEITAGQRAWFRAKALELPRRCPACRAARRAHRPEDSGNDGPRA